jgi:CHAT domain
MSPEETDVDRRIATLEAALRDLPAESAELGVTRVALAGARAARYITGGGTDDDRARAAEIAAVVLADPSTTAEARQQMSMLQASLTLVSATPAAALREHGPRMDADALRATLQWEQGADPVATAAGLDTFLQQLRAVPDPSSLPPALRSSMQLMELLVPLMGTADGTVPDGTVERLEAGLAAAHPDVPGLDLLPGLLAMLRPAPPTGDRAAADRRVAELETALGGLSGDHLLAPVLQRDLAQALINGAGHGHAGLERATALMVQAAAGMAPDHPMHDETVRMLAGALVADAASAGTSERLARAEQVAADVLRQSRDDGPAGRGADLFLRSMVGLLRAQVEGSRDAAAAVQDLVDAIALLPRDHALRPVAEGQLAAVLADRHLMDGLLENADAATYILDRAVTTGADEETNAFLVCVAAMTGVNRAVRLDDAAAVAQSAAALRAGLARLPDPHLLRSNLELVLAVADLRTATSGAGDVGAALAAVQRVATAGTFPGIAPGVVAGMVDTLDVLKGLVGGDGAAIVDGINRMERELAATTALPYHRAGQHALLGKAYLAARDVGINPDEAAARAVRHLATASGLLGDQRADVPRLDVLRDLAAAYRARGEAEPARRAAFEALELLAGTVLLQTGVAHAVVTARGAAADAVALTRWCLADGDVTAAVRAAELGRGLTLHAATSALQVPDLLRRVGQPELARAWQREAAARRDDPAPWTGVLAGAGDVDHARAASDLRHQVLDVLRGTPEAVRLFTAPPTADLAAALAALDTDALVYLLPGEEGAGGHLLVVDRDGGVAPVPAPHLHDDGRVLRFQRTADPGSPEWRAELEDVCDWAGTAVIEPLLDALGSRSNGVPRVVLVPSGPLAVVPWSAARLPGPRYACEELVLSTVASGRQFLDVACRVALPLPLAPVLVAAPTGDLSGTVTEVVALWEAFYPDATVLGDLSSLRDPAAPDDAPGDGPGTPQEVLARLPGATTVGASLLHLSCHAVAGETVEASHLTLTEPLSIRTVVEHAAGRAVDAPGPLVVLSSCVSDVTRDHFDEALTLATAFLASGAVTVVGSRWDVDDARTAALMFAFHHFLLRQGRPPADALRLAQLWMRDPARAGLPDMPEALRGDVEAEDLTDLEAWAAFGHSGR